MGFNLINKKLKLVKVSYELSPKEYAEKCAKRDFQKIKEKYDLK